MILNRSKTKRFLSSENSVSNKINNNKHIFASTNRYAILNIETDKINNMETNQTRSDSNQTENRAIMDTDLIKTKSPPPIFVRELLD